MGHWVRAVLGSSVVSLAAIAACSGSQTYSPLPKPGCAPLYYENDPLPAVPNGAALCPAGPCNYQTQTGCGPGEVCAPHADKTSGKVVPACRVAGKRGKGEACDDTVADPEKQCGVGLECAEGTCHTMCCGGDWSACAPDEGCVWHTEMSVGDAGTLTPTGLDLCFPVGDCDPLVPSSCNRADRSCRIADARGKVSCLLPKAPVEGDPCDTDHQCAGGFICAGGDKTTPFVCRKLCPWGVCADVTCTDAEGVCVHFTRDPSGVGECTPNFHGTPLAVDGGFVGDAAALLPPPPPPDGG